MGACFSSPGDSPSGKKSKTPNSAFSITVAFPAVPPYTLAINPSDKVSKIRDMCVQEMQRRHAANEEFVRIEGKLMTLDPDTGEAQNLNDVGTVREANLEPKQYVWFHDQSENVRVEDLILRSSRLNENRAHNSRGVKHGMALIKAEEGPDAVPNVVKAN